MHDAVVVRLSAGGETTWMRQFGSSNLDDPFGVSVNASGIYVAGLTGGSLPGQKNAGNVDAFVAKLDLASVAPLARRMRRCSAGACGCSPDAGRSLNQRRGALSAGRGCCRTC